MSVPVPLPKGVAAEMTCGACPVQIEGTVDGVSFYFRARHDQWAFSAGEDPVGISLGWKPGFLLEGSYGSGFDAGYMPHDVAWGIVLACVEAFRQWRDRSKPFSEVQAA